jgi:hypothetical protein
LEAGETAAFCQAGGVAGVSGGAFHQIGKNALRVLEESADRPPISRAMSLIIAFPDFSCVKYHFDWSLR